MNDTLKHSKYVFICFYDTETDMFLYINDGEKAQWGDPDSIDSVNLFSFPISPTTDLDYIIKIISRSNIHLSRYDAYPLLKERREYVVIVPIGSEYKPRFDLVDRY